MTKLEPSCSTSSAPASAAASSSSSSSAPSAETRTTRAPLELPRDRARRAEVAAVLRELVANLGGGAVAVVGKRLDEHGDAVGPVPLVDDGVEARPVRVRARALRDRAVDVVLRHRVRARLLDRVLEREVRRRVGPALLRRDDDRARELREELAALGVGRALLVLDRRPLAMPGHSAPPSPAPGTARVLACRPSARGGTTRAAAARRGRAPARRRARRAPRRPPRRRGSAARG